ERQETSRLISNDQPAVDQGGGVAQAIAGRNVRPPRSFATWIERDELFVGDDDVSTIADDPRARCDLFDELDGPPGPLDARRRAANEADRARRIRNEGGGHVARIRQPHGRTE